MVARELSPPREVEPSPHPDAVAAVRFDRVSKRFRKGFRYHSLREDVALFLRALAHPGRPRHAPDEFHALRNVTFTVGAGEALGIIGSNGAGKSTTLKLIARVSYPDEGTIRARGRVAALLEAGAGLHPELSGHDNVFLSGAILGMSRAEIERQYDAIVGFAELSEFMSMPVKRFSTGMYVRLGFSVAAHTDPDILLVDEALSVGDMGFQAKSLDRMLAFRQQGVTIIFVSHYLPAIAQMCDRVLWLEQGETRMLGETASVLEAYQEFQDRKIQRAQKAEDLQGWDVGGERWSSKPSPLTAGTERPPTASATKRRSFSASTTRPSGAWSGPTSGWRFAIPRGLSSRPACTSTTLDRTTWKDVGWLSFSSRSSPCFPGSTRSSAPSGAMPRSPISVRG